jgi:hypothetical protein
MSKTGKKLLAGCLLVLLAAAGAYFLGREQDRIRSLYGDAPQTVTLGDLAVKGYGNNVWLDLTQVELGPKYAVGRKGGEIRTVWVPAFPRGKARQAKSIQVVLRSTRCRDEADIDRRFAGQSSFRGAVINPTLLKPYDPYRPLLQKEYPGVALAPTIWEVDVDRTEKPSERWALGFYVAAVALGLVGALCGLAAVGLGTGSQQPPQPAGAAAPRELE